MSMERNKDTNRAEPQAGPTRRSSAARSFLTGMLLAAGTCFVAAETSAQFGWRGQGGESVDSRLGKDNAMLRRALAPDVTPASHATLPLYAEASDGPVRLAYATAVSSDGFVITKASELEPDFYTELPTSGSGSQIVKGRIVGVARDHDLAAIKLDLPEGVTLEPVEFSNAAVSDAGAGSFVLTPDTLVGNGRGDVSPLAVGNVSVGTLRKIPATGLQLGIRFNPNRGGEQAGVPIARVEPGGPADKAGLRKGDLIIARDGRAVGTRQDFERSLRFDRPGSRFTLTVSRAGEEQTFMVELGRRGLGFTVSEEIAGVFIDRVFPGSAAEEAGIVPMDLITEINGNPIRSGEALIQTLQEFKSGDRVRVGVLRYGRPLTLNVQIGNTRSNERAILQNRLGGSTLSRRGADFPSVIQHDSVLGADEMGSPIVDLEGRVLGLNIARAGRVETYALPAQVLNELIPDLLAGKYSPATAGTAPEEGLPPPQDDLQP